MGIASLPKAYLVENKETGLVVGVLKEEVPVNTIKTVFERSLVEKIKDWIKIVGYSTFWISTTSPAASGSLTLLGSRCKEFKNFLAFRELHGKLANLGSSTLELMTTGTSTAARSVFLNSATFFNSFADAVDFTSRFVALNSVFLGRVASLNVFATLGGTSVGALKEWRAFDKATKECNVESQILSLLNLAMNVSYVAYGAFTVFCMSAGVPLSVPFIMTCLTAATVFGLAGYFYEKMYDPNQKNSDIDLAKLAPRIQFTA